MCTLINNLAGRHVENSGDMLGAMISWIDNNNGSWYYNIIQEATNSHYYDKKTDGKFEKWSR